jgi:group I intron endonuclease
MNYADAGYVYAIRNTVNNRAYIGSTSNYKSRWHTHRSTLRRGVHHSFILQKAWNKYGEAAFSFDMLVICPKDQRIEYETRLMALESYNVLRTPKESGVRGGWRHSEEFKSKMSMLNKGKKLTEEHKIKLSTTQLGRKHGAAFVEKARRRQTGVTPSVGTRGKLSAAVKLARSEERAKNLEAAKSMYAQAASGVPLHVVFDGAKISSVTFYKYCKELGLPTLKHRKAQA